MFTQKREVVALAAALTALTMAGGFGAMRLAAHPAPARAAVVQTAPAQAAPVAPPAYEDGGGGEQS